MGYPKKKYASKSKTKKTYNKKSNGKRYKNGSSGSYSNNRSSYTRKSSGGTSYANNRNKRRSTGQGTYSRASISTEGTYGKRAGGLGRAVTKSVIAPLRDTATGNISFDTVPLGGVRVRFTCLTDPKPVIQQSKAFDGPVRWKGFTEFIDYEFTGGGPFTHRRILFSSAVPWGVHHLKRGTEEVCVTNNYYRVPGRDIADLATTKCLRRLFVEPTTRGMVSGPLASTGLTVLKNEVFSLVGSETGRRAEAKLWNNFGTPGKKDGRVVKYERQADQSFSMELEDNSYNQHIYLCDVFHYGVDGLDINIPSEEYLMSPAPPSVVKQEVASPGENMPRPKRQHNGSNSSSDYEMLNAVDAMKIDSMNPLKAGQGIDQLKRDIRAVEQPSRVVRCLSTMRLYWYDP